MHQSLLRFAFRSALAVAVAAAAFLGASCERTNNTNAPGADVAATPGADDPAPAAAAKGGLPAPTTPKAGMVQGWVADTVGAPLAGAVVHIFGTTMAGESTRFEVTADADGRFRQRVPEGIYGVRAEHVVVRNGKNFPVALHPVDNITARQHDSAEGIAKDFVWKISGLRPGAIPGEPATHNEPGKYYGGSLQVSVEPERSDAGEPFPAGATIRAQLTPVGPLFDGRPGETVSFSRTFDDRVRSTAYWYPCDIPLGRYALQLTLETPGQPPRPLSWKPSLEFNAPFAETGELDIIPGDSSGVALPIQISVKP